MVLESRQSSHIGDIALGLYPRTPEKGDIIVLGEGGVLFSEFNDRCGVNTIGLEPINGRQDLWLNPRALYDVHESLVRLFFCPL